MAAQGAGADASGAEGGGGARGRGGGTAAAAAGRQPAAPPPAPSWQASAPDVYAIGDVTAFPLQLADGSLVRQEHVTCCRCGRR